MELVHCCTPQLPLPCILRAPRRHLTIRAMQAHCRRTWKGPSQLLGRTIPSCSLICGRPKTLIAHYSALVLDAGVRRFLEHIAIPPVLRTALFTAAVHLIPFKAIIARHISHANLYRQEPTLPSPQIDRPSRTSSWPQEPSQEFVLCDSSDADKPPRWMASTPFCVSAMMSRWARRCRLSLARELGCSPPL